MADGDPLEIAIKPGTRFIVDEHGAFVEERPSGSSGRGKPPDSPTGFPVPPIEAQLRYRGEWVRRDQHTALDELNEALKSGRPVVFRLSDD
jgi:hypothetical protein